MKKGIFVTVLCLAIGQIAAAQGIVFEKSDWNQLLAKAKAENKIIFVDAYTTWCGPCKMMDKEVFTAKEVGDYYNANFINAKIDMEKGDGVTIAQKYEVQAYPSFLFVDGNGELIGRGVGYQPGEQFLALAKRVLDPEMKFSVLKKRFEEGDRDPAFLKKLLTVADANNDPMAEKVAALYLNTQSDLTTQENMMYLLTYGQDINSPMFDKLLSQRENIAKQYGVEMTDRLFKQLVFTDGMKMEYTEEQALSRVEEGLKRVRITDSKAAMAEFKSMFYSQRDMPDSYAAATIEYVKSNPDMDYSDLNNYAWQFYETVDDKAQLKEALGWALRSVEKSKEYFNMDTLAALYYKTGNKKKAKKTALEAIQLAKASGEDYSGTEELLSLMKKK